MNRALSDAYYALFHTLCRLCADTLAGAGPTRNDAAWLQAYRTLDHGAAKNGCLQARNRRLPTVIVRFAEAFVELQDWRHLADYDPTVRFKRSDVLTRIERAERAIADLRTASRPELRAFVALVLLPSRRRG